MNYEKKYKEALERMKSWAKGEHPECFSEAQKAAEFIFPELKESEDKDETIRQCLIEHIKCNKDLNWSLFQWFKPDTIITWLEKQGEKKPAENVEIKFCEGDKIVSNQNGRVYTVGTTYYVAGDGEDICLHDTDGNHLWTNRDDLDKNYHLWTIQEAKEGDVLDDGSCIFIIQKLCDNSTTAKTYCTLHIDGDFDDGSILYFDIDNTKPATQEQRDLLFQKMKEAGYEWDANKKELKKIGPKKLDANKVINWVNPDKVIEWLKITINERAVYNETHLTLPYNSIEGLINDFKEDFGLC